MKKNIVKILAAGAVLFMAASCDMDLVPEGSFVYDPENIITNQNDLDGFEAGVVAQFRGIFGGVFDEPQDIMVDYFNAVSDYGNNYGGVHRSGGDLDASNYDTRDNWRYPFLAMKNFNIVINGAKTVPDGLQESAAIARGEAFVARAYAYLHMIRLFAKPYGANAATDLGLPLVLEYDQNARPARASVKEIYDQIKADLDSAAVLLKGVKGEPRAQKPTIDLVDALYARYYLDTKDYAKAAASAHKIIDSGTYKLAATAEEMEAEFVNDNGTEAIMQFFGNLQEGGYMSHTFYAPMQKDSDKGLYYRPYFVPTKTLLDSYEATDLRLACWYSDGKYPVFVNGNYYETELTVFKRFSGNPALRTDDVPNTRQMIKPILLSEMYLIAAEAELSSNAAAAKTDLNALQAARGASQTEATLENVQKEWYRETVGLGLRMPCLKRWGLGFNGRPGQPQAVAKEIIVLQANFADKVMKADDSRFVWPVPTHEIQVNRNLVQNDGYTSVEVE